MEARPAPSLLFPLWARLGVLYGSLIGSSIAGYSAWEHVLDRDEERSRLRGEMEAVAGALAAGIDGDVFESIVREDDRLRPSFRAIGRTLRTAVDTAGSITWAGTSRRDDRGRWVWVVEQETDDPYPVGFPIFDGETHRESVMSGDVVYVDVYEDEAGRWREVFAPIRNSAGTVVGVLEVAADSDRDALQLAGRAWRTTIQAVAALLVALLVSIAFGRFLSANLARLADAARRVARGELKTRVNVRSNDEIGVLAHAFDRMVEGLEEREFIRDTFGRFVHPDVVQGILADRSRLRLGGEARVVTVLMTDLRGFAGLSEELGPENMVALLNRYFAKMTEVVARFEGNVSELLGDGMVVLFGAPVAHDDDAARAIACAVAMQEALVAFNITEGRELQMGIGVDSGTVIAGNIGSDQHMKYGVVGGAINMAARLEGATIGNQILATRVTLDKVGPDVVTGETIELRVKGRRRPIKCAVVLAADGRRVPTETAFARVEVDLPARVWRFEGKTVVPESLPARITRLDPTGAELRTDAHLELRERLMLTFQLDGTDLDQVQCVVEALQEDVVSVRLTGMPSAVRHALEVFAQQHTEETAS